MKNTNAKFGDDVEGLTLLGALEQLRDDILKLQEDMKLKQRSALFLIEEGELELKLVAKREKSTEAKGGGKIRLYIFEGDAGANIAGSESKEHVQTLKIKFRAIRPENLKDMIGTTFGFGSPFIKIEDT